jgi:hypothetical protein
MPVGGRDGGPLEVRLTREKFDQLTDALYQRCRLPLDQVRGGKGGGGGTSQCLQGG